MTEVHEPVDDLRTTQAVKTKSLTGKLSRLHKDLKQLEDRYRALQRRYDRSWHDAHDRCAECLAAGGDLPAELPASHRRHIHLARHQ